VKTIHKSKYEKDSMFAKDQEAAWKDVEQAFGVLQSH
jgi:hypothetical protein